ncbi:hypothetical protein OIV83_003822 [Microbotryomycetes sp. JL201]|nr:hypothetical protein OIV83_003822 [Microbotryomycetes sp. JL201]
MTVRYVLDDYYLAITFLVSLGLQASLFVVSFLLQTDKLTDFAGSLGFFTLALLSFFLGNEINYNARNIIATQVVASAFAIIDSSFLLFRVLKTGGDSRFDEIRSNVFKFGFFWFSQALWGWTVSLPVTILNSPRVSDPTRGGGRLDFGTAGDIIGIILFALGWAIEICADDTKYRFKSRKPPRGTINDRGVWKWSRHPNYFGEIMLWWGIYALCVSPATHDVVSGGGKRALEASVVGPIFITLLLLFASGIPTAEKPTAKKYYLMSHGADREAGDKWAEYKAYLNRTSILFPIPPSLYRPLPRWVKTYILLDLPMYHFQEHTEGPEAIEEEKRKRSRV